MQKETYRIGLDVGIGSIGWAVVSSSTDGHPARIEDFGVRIFKSGEDPKKKTSLCQDRRGNRGVRRLERRRSYRKRMVKNHLQNIGLIGNGFNDELADCRDADVYKLKARGLDEQLSPAELYRCLIHTCNHRGYREFYEPSEDDDEAGMNESAANSFEKAFRESGKRTVSEYLISTASVGDYVKFKNRSGGDMEYRLIRRDLLHDEAEKILTKQSGFYRCLTRQNIERTLGIMFAQRDFEDGPGNPNDKDRRYQGFIEKLGKCPFCKDEDRGFRGTVLSDVFAVTNTLSQYRFVSKETGEYCLDKNVAEEIVDYLLQNAKLGISDVKRILKSHGFELLKGEGSDDKALGKALKYLPMAKKCVEEAGFDWNEIISEDQFDFEKPSLLHRIGELISMYQTPRRRREEMRKAGVDDKLIKAFSCRKVSGTSSVSYKYMTEAISAFLDGDIYGNFQANYNKNAEENAPVKREIKLLPSHIDDPEVRDNRVVFKAINETRKIVNAIIDVYGSPEEIVIEVASELGKSVEMRNKETRRQRNNEQANDKIKEEIASLLKIDVGDVKPVMTERFKLFREQEGKCAYSGKPLGELKEVIDNRDKKYEIDHIVPYSLILDNTLNNKALVFAGENQKKGQRTPLMYLGAEDAKNYIAFVNHMYSRKENPISKKKLDYFKLKSIYGEKAEEILGGWKSRNINDTRYITKYIAGLFERNLIFTGEKKHHVQTVKGSVTQKFRREWFRGTRWGTDEKSRDTYLNHALDALVAANLTRPYIEIGSDALRLISIYKSHRNTVTPEYDEYLGNCVTKMKKYYGFDEEYTRRLLSRTGRVPAYVPRLSDEVSVRFWEGDADKFEENINRVYGNEAPFVCPPHIPVTSHKPEKKFKGEIADSNPVRIVEIDGVPHKIRRVDIKNVGEKTLGKLYTGDPVLKERLEEILLGKGEKYTVETYLGETGENHFTDGKGHVIRKLSVDDGPVSNFYRKDNGDGNYTVLGMLKYYCVEVYKDKDGNTAVCGVRFVDVVKKGKKLYRKEESLPENYSEHVMYLFPGDYIRVIDGKGKLKFEGYYVSVKTMGRSQFYFKESNISDSVVESIARKDSVRKVYVDILGKIGGEVKCSEPLPCIPEKRSR